MTWQRIQTDRVGRFGIVTISHLPANALRSQPNIELEETIRFFLGVPEVKVLITTGEGRGRYCLSRE